MGSFSSLFPSLSTAHAQLHGCNPQDKLIRPGKRYGYSGPWGLNPEPPEWETEALLIYLKGHPTGQASENSNIYSHLGITYIFSQNQILIMISCFIKLWGHCSGASDLKIRMSKHIGGRISTGIDDIARLNVGTYGQKILGPWKPLTAALICVWECDHTQEENISIASKSAIRKIFFL